jgi:TRAP-type uncharacterized transport system fused permease subunit
MRPTLIASLAAATAAFHLWAAGWAPFTALVQRPVHLALLGSLGLLGLGLQTPHRKTGRRAQLVDALLIVGLLASCGYLVAQHEALVRRAGTATTLDLIAAGIALVVVLELARRMVGWGLVAVAVAALV